MFHDLETIGKGAFGRVVKTRLVQYGSGLFSWLRGASQIPELDLAMKILRTDFENAEKEVDLLKTFQHPNIVRYFQSFSVSKDYFEVLFFLLQFQGIVKLRNTDVLFLTIRISTLSWSSATLISRRNWKRSKTK